MSKIFNTIGSLTTLKLQLEENNIYDFKSLKEVIDFQNSFAISRQQLIYHHKNQIEKELTLLNIELKSLEATIDKERQQIEGFLTNEIEELKQQLDFSIRNTSANIFQKTTKVLIHWNYKRKIKNKENEFANKVKTTISSLNYNLQEKNNRYQFITSNIDEAVKQSVHHPLSELERKKAVVDQLNSFIYGALGEQKVVKTLENLSDEYFLINDFSVSFSKAIYYGQENDYIKSTQIDHILVAPSGIFLIETKNWSEKSIDNLNLRSPVEQIRRASFILYKLLNSNRSSYHMRLDSHHWGNKKISIKNLIVMTNTKPQGEFQYVKILTLNELIGYIQYFKPLSSGEETQRIAEFLLRINGRKFYSL
jgi:hypothetical protein